MDYYKRIEELTCLSELDESADYETDYSGIYTDGKKFYFIAASGCSCWDGDYTESVYNSFKALKKALISDDLSDYTPSLSGVRYLIETAESCLSASKVKRELSSDESLLDWLDSNLG